MFFGSVSEAVPQLLLMVDNYTLLSLISDLTSSPLTHDKLDGPDTFFNNHTLNTHLSVASFLYRRLSTPDTMSSSSD